MRGRWAQNIAELPAENYFVTLIGEFAVRKGGAYEFCAPNKDGSVHLYPFSLPCSLSLSLFRSLKLFRAAHTQWGKGIGNLEHSTGGSTLPCTWHIPS